MEAATKLGSLWGDLLDTIGKHFAEKQNDVSVTNVDLLQKLAVVDQQLQEKLSSFLSTQWKDIRNLGSVPITAEEAQSLLALKPNPLGEIFVEAGRPTDDDVMKAVASKEASSNGEVALAFHHMLICSSEGAVDGKILESLSSITCKMIETSPSRKLQFTFSFTPDAKKYFKNDSLVLTLVGNGVGLGGDMTTFRDEVVAIAGTKVDWVSGNPTLMKVPAPADGPSKRPRNEGKKKPAFIEIRQPSFFNAFEDFDFVKLYEKVKDDQEDPDLEDLIKEKRMLVARLLDYYVYSSLLPVHALKRMCPEDADDEDDGMGMDEDEMMDGDFDDEEEEEEEAPQPAKKSSRKEASSGSAKPAPECKQQ
mmetsp:Transcript_40754/g.47396  ORF Transcript_40754/g.47396 Transcript_40754/m.47396 type:complete len:364 (-) Transcript_40754:79-1170(-)|eukprot:CAMPEP_0176425606 /NCGR_PEP_ID=MMETSP0127-20121128/11479_1 /TAXON_ID=938130 /ORGANISM="Platyophrya macrostoma, Strain WH" /LENGTH=363 /DNA_ID=CAMNT_0017806779 /DNA_START=61 /DNA_END=1152 /DNA_ORIENTATION=-